MVGRRRLGPWRRAADPFAPVAAIGRTLPDVEETTTWGKPTLKVGGTMFVCIASQSRPSPTRSS